MTWVTALNGALVIVAVAAAFGVKERNERSVAVICAATLFPVWAVCALCFYAPLSPAYLLDVRSVDIWSVMDLCAGLTVAAIAIRYWWGRILWLSFVLQVALHVARWETGLIERGAYYNALDFVFYAQVSLFLMMGGRTIVERIDGKFSGFLHGAAYGRRRVFRVLHLLAPESLDDVR